MDYDYDRERWEAITAGEATLNSLSQALECLDSARNWGIFDILGGGLLTTFAKHSKIDDAKRYINEARANMEIFRNELADINEVINIEEYSNDFLAVADFFFDGFLVDMAMQSRINQMRTEVQQAITKVGEMLERLREY